jgi:hypothetical protein
MGTMAPAAAAAAAAAASASGGSGGASAGGGGPAPDRGSAIWEAWGQGGEVFHTHRPNVSHAAAAAAAVCYAASHGPVLQLFRVLLSRLAGSLQKGEPAAVEGWRVRETHRTGSAWKEGMLKIAVCSQSHQPCPSAAAPEEPCLLA